MKLYIPMAALAVALASTAVWAQDRPLTRAEVKAELERARADGSLQRLNSDYYDWWDSTNQGTAPAGAAGRSFDRGEAAMQGGKTRAEVKEELRRARDSGELQRLQESYGPGGD
ncbi:DUF4148 domain-containing protein [uncultured Azohydromonas sp.]|jgi:hypothetical protein|uniref:DUF4148 domain-containing protein n=1 Tax=uncultured Azohydromonas sp. TaxID=487342 RepID=UPI002617D899|nr:DUF4148 domain-containing protein [uncultured Azohydromonas sp.]